MHKEPQTLARPLGPSRGRSRARRCYSRTFSGCPKSQGRALSQEGRWLGTPGAAPHPGSVFGGGFSVRLWFWGIFECSGARSLQPQHLHGVERGCSSRGLSIPAGFLLVFISDLTEGHPKTWGDTPRNQQPPQHKEQSCPSGASGARGHQERWELLQRCPASPPPHQNLPAKAINHLQSPHPAGHSGHAVSPPSTPRLHPGPLVPCGEGPSWDTHVCHPTAFPSSLKEKPWPDYPEMILGKAPANSPG